MPKFARAMYKFATVIYNLTKCLLATKKRLIEEGEEEQDDDDRKKKPSKEEVECVSCY